MRGTVDSDEEALELMNDSLFGLTAAVFTEDQRRFDTMARRLDVGTVFRNRCDYLDPYLPWSGRTGCRVCARRPAMDEN